MANTSVEVILSMVVSTHSLEVSNPLWTIVNSTGLFDTEAVVDTETAKDFSVSETPIPVSEIARRINEYINDENMTKLKYQSITSFLIQGRFLREVLQENGKIAKHPTPEGKLLGITLEERRGEYGSYYVTLYDADAQRYIIDNIEAIVQINAVPVRKPENLEPSKADQ